MAWIIAALTIIGFLVMLIAGAIGGAALSQYGSRYGASGLPSMFGPLWGVIMAFYILIIGGIWFISLLAGAEMILVWLAIEENTRAMVQKPTA